MAWVAEACARKRKRGSAAALPLHVCSGDRDQKLNRTPTLPPCEVMSLRYRPW
jgi:hypothetical protein